MARGDEQHRNPKSNIEIAQEAEMRPIGGGRFRYRLPPKYDSTLNTIRITVVALEVSVY